LKTERKPHEVPSGKKIFYPKQKIEKREKTKDLLKKGGKWKERKK
jgi:hypothetical protein